MKQFALLCILPIMLSIALSSSAHGQSSLAFGMVYSFQIKQYGLDARGYYEMGSIMKDLTGVGEYMYWLGSMRQRGAHWNLDFNANYVLVRTPWGFGYGLGGIDLRHSGDESGIAVGLNVGGGGEVKLDFGGIFGELRFLLGSESSVVLAGGLRVNVGGN